jgi:hypothetical protein
MKPPNTTPSLFPAQAEPVRGDSFEALKYSKPDGAALRDAAIQRVKDHADPDWFDRAMEAGRHVAGRMSQFTTDDLVAVMNAAGVPPPREPRAWGPVMQQLAKDGVCVATDRTKNSVQPQNHGRMMRVWRSMVVQTQGDAK